VVPGIGTIQGCCASNQVSAICAGVARLCSPIVSKSSTTGRFALRAGGVNRGKVLRLSLLPNIVVSSILPVNPPVEMPTLSTFTCPCRYGRMGEVASRSADH
jgi:hypothetical protein